MRYPRLSFRYAHPLDQDRRALYAERNLGDYPSIEEVEETVLRWRLLWDQVNQDDRVWKVIYEVVGYSHKSDLEVAIFGAGLKAMSTPFIIPIRKRGNTVVTDDDFLETVIHELLHRVLADRENHEKISAYWDSVRARYANENAVVRNHILLFAVLSAVLRRLFGEEKFLTFIKPQHPDYQRALAIVSEKGEDVLIREFRDFLGV